MFADEIRLAIEASSRITLPAVTALLWRAYGEGKVSEAEAEALSALIEARVNVGKFYNFRHNLSPTQVLRSPDLGTSTDMRRISSDVPAGAGPAFSLSENPIVTSDRQRRPVAGVGSRPVSSASLERRRRWAASGRLPPALATRFTLAEQAVLSLVAAETTRRGDCRLAVGHVAAVVGVAETTVRNAIREARQLGLLTVEERRITGFRNDTNIIRIVAPEWVAWLRLARKGVPRKSEDKPVGREGIAVMATPLGRGGGCKSPNRTPTQISNPGKTGTARPPRGRIAAHGRAS